METYNKVIFALITLALIYTLFRRKKAVAPADTEKSDARFYAAAFAAIAVIGTAIRLWQLGTVPSGVNQDGAMAAVDALALADHGTDRFGTWLPAHLYAWGFGQMSSLMSYLMVPFIRLFGLNVITMRLPLLLASLMGGVFLTLFVRDGFGRRAALITAALVAVNPWHFMQSRWALDCNLLPHFFIAALFFLQSGLLGRRRRVYISMVFFALCMYCYGVTIYTVPLFLVCAGAGLLIKHRLSVKELLLCAGIYLVISLPFILTMAVNTFKWDTISLPFVTIQRFPDSVRSGDILFFSANPLSQLRENLRSLLNVAFLQKKDLPWNDMYGFGTMYLFALPLEIAGLVRLIREKGTAKALTLGGLASGIWVGLVTNSVNVNRVNLIFCFLLILAALGAELIIRSVRHSAIPTALVLAVSAALMLNSYFGTYAEAIKYSFYDGFGEALAAAESYGTDRIFVTADTQYEGSRNVSEILTMFYDRTDALYFQGRSLENHGETMPLPYSERFTYLSMDENAAQSATDYKAACVIRANDIMYFVEDFYLTKCGEFYCAIPKW